MFLKHRGHFVRKAVKGSKWNPNLYTLILLHYLLQYVLVYLLLLEFSNLAHTRVIYVEFHRYTQTKSKNQYTPNLF
ncbi:hypothetical protein FF38_03424 [Lucilia cuprina]|uniref:Uncharacterized protein n=1 Tax=Lucilia cuprina TaxID=7375 RepID=A0A0L0BRD1_LUCCU|nr:hypothetical protein FF38_03424 [Lucilia cuprina]